MMKELNDNQLSNVTGGVNEYSQEYNNCMQGCLTDQNADVLNPSKEAKEFCEQKKCSQYMK